MNAVFTTEFESNDLTQNTIPKIKKYASTIGCDFIKITKRRFPQFGESYEKMQIFELGIKNDWNIFINWDVVIGPKMINMIKECPIDSVGHWGKFGAFSWFDTDDYFNSDIEIINETVQVNNVIQEIQTERPKEIAFNDAVLCVPNVCHNVWKPTELSTEEAVKRSRRFNWLGQWNLARNCAKYKLKDFQFSSNYRKMGGQHDDECLLLIEASKGEETQRKIVQRLDKYYANYNNI